MPQICSVCKHPNRDEIDKLLLRNETLDSVANSYNLSQSAVHRHKSKHLVGTELAIVHQEQEELREISINDELKKIFHRISLLFDACDRWLRDPDNPEQYNIDLRSNEIMVHYYFDLETERTTKRIKKKALLSTLLNEIMLKTERDFDGIELVETKHADFRELTLQTARELQKQLEFVARLMGMVNDKPQINMQVAFVQSPEYLKLKDIIVRFLSNHPESRSEFLAMLRDAKQPTDIIDL